ncbi:hypothetical protein QYE76_043007 [Lolium multiflorum]|uniref:CCHC-type domain-containing protein n=1 Tax=Lolium multiflorum TaxID=4521 RepID=A0AAD8WVP4_LOLMU|nr:hypothetical protein QYE76_043007 [Lolium multiflorum]
MEGLCFRCFRPGQHKRECSNESICFRCGNDGHEAKDCKHPRSPPSEDELRRAALASFARHALIRVKHTPIGNPKWKV